MFQRAGQIFESLQCAVSFCWGMHTSWQKHIRFTRCLFTCNAAKDGKGSSVRRRATATQDPPSNTMLVEARGSGGVGAFALWSVNRRVVAAAMSLVPLIKIKNSSC